MRLLFGIPSVLMSANVALGQVQTDAAKQVTSESSTAIQWLITAVFLVGTLVIAFKPAKRAKLE